MRKIQTLFVRDFEHDHGRYVTRQVTPGCEWVMDGLGTATRKWDGTAVLVIAPGDLWVRREVKAGGVLPAGFVLIEYDETTGKSVGWEPASQSGFFKHIQAALVNAPQPVTPGTYELVGPHVNGNPDEFGVDMLVPHGMASTVVQRDYGAIEEFLLINHRGWEGLVFWERPGDLTGRLAKIKARDFRGPH